MATGRRIVVWNRTPERAAGLAAEGADVRTDVTEAVTGAPLIIISVATTDDVRQVLSKVPPARLEGRTVLNVTSGTPQDAHSLRDWARPHKIVYLDAATAAYPEQIGTQQARILVAGAAEAWEAVQDVVRDLAGSAMYVGSDHSAANAIDGALTGAFYIPSLVAFLEAARIMHHWGADSAILPELAAYAVAQLDGELKNVLARIASGDFSTNQATLNVYSDATGAFAAGLAPGSEAKIITTTAQILRDAVDAGAGEEDIAVLFNLNRQS
jgi:3-hydroxyisobutyrate dehydrogenase-like beta-hydroxyacid dehydrogenase